MNPEKKGRGVDLERPIKYYAWVKGGREKCLRWLEQPRAEEQSIRNFMVIHNILDWGIDRGWLNPSNFAMTSKDTRSNRKALSNPFL